MRTGWILLLIGLFIGPLPVYAQRGYTPFRDAMPPAAIASHKHGSGTSTIRRPWQKRIHRHRFPRRFTPKRHRPIDHGHGHGRWIRPPIPDRRRHWWPTTTTIVKEVPTVIIVQPLPPALPEPREPKEVWVPPVMGERTEPGYWDYGVKRVWMGDHWRYEQDITKKSWVPPSQVTYVKQAGYWKVVE